MYQGPDLSLDYSNSPKGIHCQKEKNDKIDTHQKLQATKCDTTT